MSCISSGTDRRGNDRTVGVLVVVLQGGDGIPAQVDIPEGEGRLVVLPTDRIL